MSGQLLLQLKGHESSVKNAAGRHTTCHCPIAGLSVGSNIKEADAEKRLRQDLVCKKRLCKTLPWVEGLGQARCGVRLNMRFNLGFSGLPGFKNTLDTVRKSNYWRAAECRAQSQCGGQSKSRAVERHEQSKPGRSHA